MANLNKYSVRKSQALNFVLLLCVNKKIDYFSTRGKQG